PSTTSSVPVMYEASSEARNSTAWATSSTRPARFIGTALIILSRHTGSAEVFELRMGGIMPGVHGVHADTVLGVLDGGGLGHDPHGALRGVVGHVHTGLADEAGDGRDVDDGAAAGSLHDR